MTCTLTVHFSTPGFGNGTDVASYTVPNVSYQNAYKVVVGGPPGNEYDVRCDGNQGTLVLATYTPSYVIVTIASSTNSCGILSAIFDCINGACINASKYNTPGIYPSLSECEIACGSGCGGKCISSSEWAQIESLSNQLKNRNCN
ncbi:hypothetical protein [Nostoc sp.]|uniref:hypothetical protein n=1 Tax=Nostoc sp. TaxID=1180 RepID=UPI002FFAD911